MTTYWCGWCGETAEAEGADRVVPCMRCAREFLELFGFWPRCAMIPLPEDVHPIKAAAETKRFVLVDPRSRKKLGATQPAA